MTIYTKASERTIKLTEEIINEHHPRLRHAKIAVIMRDKATKSKGKIVLATAEKFPEKAKPFTAIQYHFIVTIAEDTWTDLEPRKKTALIDHELCHLGFDENGSPTIIGHDVEEFLAVIARHGLWEEALQDMAEVVNQLEQIPFDFGEGYRGSVEAIEPGVMVAV